MKAPKEAKTHADVCTIQTSKELQDLAYELIEKARDGGKLGKGVNEATKYV